MRVSIFAYLTCVICLVVGEDFLSPLSAPKQTIQFSAGEWKKIGYLGYELDAFLWENCVLFVRRENIVIFENEKNVNKNYF